MSSGSLGPVLVNDWQVVLGPHGVLVSRSGQPAPTFTPRYGAAVLPEPFPDLVGRASEVSAVFDGLRTESVTEVWGECGIGKTSLLRHVGHRVTTEFVDWPVVYLSAAGRPLEDLLQDVHRCLYQSRQPTKLGQAALRADLRRTRSVLLLDDMSLSAADLADLLRSLPESRLVLASPMPRSDGCRSIQLSGLEEPAAIELVRRGLEPRALEGDELDDARALSEVLRGHHLRLLQAAGLVRAGRRTMRELVASLGRGDPADLLARECQGALSPEQRMLVAALAMAAGAFLPTNLVEDMCQISYAASKLRDLCERHVIDQRRDRFGLPACSIGEPRELVRKSFERGLAMHGLVHWLQHPGTSPDDLLSLSHSLVTIVDVAAESGDWHTVLDIVHVVEPVLIVAGHWQQWRYAEETGLHAAEQLGDDLERAYHLHELGSRALALGSYDQARPLLEKAGSLRSRRGGSGARRVTVHNQGLIARPAWWRQARTAGAAAAVAVAVLIVATVIALARPPLSSHGGSTGPARTASSPTPSATTTLTTVPVPASTPVQSPIQSITPPSPSPSAQAPIIVRITPTAGPEAGGTRVVISGRGFADATRVSFGKVVVTGFTIDSDVQISAVTPAGAGSVDVRVASPAGISLVTKADLFTYVPAPVIKSISPSSGPQGTLVKISGTSFTGTSGASFGTAAARVTFVSDTEIDAVSPAGSGTVDVRVTTPDGTSAINTQTDQFTYTPIQ